MKMPQIFADLHIHSKYSRATSRNLDLDNLARYARIKGLDVLGTGDFTHPLWMNELKQKLKGEGGIYSYGGMNFILSCEISLMYRQDGKGRRIHHILLAPSLDVASQINEWLDTRGRRDYDGRPIFGFSSIELADAMTEISKGIEIIPAHAWTPYFGIFGSISGFDSIKECFRDKAKCIHAIETGLSSDPAMNWRIRELDGYSLVSFSDAHSFWPWRLGRECTAFDIKKLGYEKILESIRKNKIQMTLEFYPEEGKYHYDGHRGCKVCMHPRETKKEKGICPKCKKPLTIGVLSRVEQLADEKRPEGFMPKGAAPFKSIVPLSELLAAAAGSGVSSKKVAGVHSKLVGNFKSEIDVLLNAEAKEIEKVAGKKVSDIILSNRGGKMKIIPGYDGEYGRLVL